MKPIHVDKLIYILQSLLANYSIKPEFQVCVWVKDGSGHRAIALYDMFPDTDYQEQMVAFRLEDQRVS